MRSQINKNIMWSHFVWISVSLVEFNLLCHFLHPQTEAGALSSWSECGMKSMGLQIQVPSRELIQKWLVRHPPCACRLWMSCLRHLPSGRGAFLMRLLVFCRACGYTSSGQHSQNTLDDVTWIITAGFWISLPLLLIQGRGGEVCMILHDFSALVFRKCRCKMRVSHAMRRKMLMFSVKLRSFWALLHGQSWAYLVRRKSVFTKQLSH